MFTHDLHHSQINILASGSERNAIDFYWKDRAKPPLRPVSPWSLRAGLRLVAARSYASERSGLVGVIAPTPRRAIQQIFNLQSSIFNSPINRDLRFATTPRAGSPLRYDRLSLSGLGSFNTKYGVKTIFGVSRVSFSTFNRPANIKNDNFFEQLKQIA
jgi:hypothetical protein